MMIPPRSAHTTLRGRRRINQDSILDAVLPDGRHVLALADGIGGQRSGEVASAMATEILGKELAVGRSLPEAARAANQAVFETSTREAACAGMGTTLVALVSSGSGYQIVNVGDSRAYRVDKTGIRQITTDHSFAAEARTAGLLSPEEIERSPWRNALTRSIGAAAEVEVDVHGPYEHPGMPHVILLCSDGLHGVVPDVAIRTRLLAARDLPSAVNDLAVLAVESQSRDNISIIAIEFGRLLGSEPTPFTRPQRNERLTASSRSSRDVIPLRPRDETPAGAAGRSEDRPSSPPIPWTSRRSGEAIREWGKDEEDLLPPISAAPALAATTSFLAAEDVEVSHSQGMSVRRRGSRGSSRKFAGMSEDAVLFAAALCGLILWLVLSILAA
jgi:PPM family protein phosphatase